MADKNRKKREGIVYSTNEEFEYAFKQESESSTLSPEKQNLKVLLDKKARAGKKVTLVSGFVGTAEDLAALGKNLKSRCGVGGTVKDGEILIQGDFREQIVKYLSEQNYKVKKI